MAAYPQGDGEAEVGGKIPRSCRVRDADLGTNILDENEGSPTQFPKCTTEMLHQDAKVSPI